MADRVTVRVDADLVGALDRFRADSEPGLRTRQDALRHIVADWLAAHGYLPATGLIPDHSDETQSFSAPPDPLPWT